MASGHDHHAVDEGGHELPGEGEPIGGFEEGDEHGHHDGHAHDDHGADDHGHGHDEHGAEGNAWVIPPLVVGLIIAIIIIVVVGGTGAGAAITG